MNRNKDHGKIFVLSSNLFLKPLLSFNLHRQETTKYRCWEIIWWWWCTRKMFFVLRQIFSSLASTTYSQDTWSWKIESKATQAVHSFELKINNCIVHTHILAIASSFHYHALSLLVMWCNCTAARASQTLWISYHHANTDCASFL